MEDVSLDATGILASLVSGLVFFVIVMVPWLCCRKIFGKIFFPRELGEEYQYKLFGWFAPTWLRKSQEILNQCGAPAVLFLKWKLSFMMFIGIIIVLSGILLIPTYVTQSESGSDTWFSITTASGLENRSLFIWVTFLFTIMISTLFLYIIILHRHGNL